MLLEKLTSASLFSIICPNCENISKDGFVVVWSSGSAEQLDAMINEITKDNK